MQHDPCWGSCYGWNRQAKFSGICISNPPWPMYLNPRVSTKSFSMTATHRVAMAFTFLYFSFSTFNLLPSVSFHTSCLKIWPTGIDQQNVNPPQIMMKKNPQKSLYTIHFSSISHRKSRVEDHLLKGRPHTVVQQDLDRAARVLEGGITNVFCPIELGSSYIFKYIMLILPQNNHLLNLLNISKSLVFFQNYFHIQNAFGHVFTYFFVYWGILAKGWPVFHYSFRILHQ